MATSEELCIGLVVRDAWVCTEGCRKAFAESHFLIRCLLCFSSPLSWHAQVNSCCSSNAPCPSLAGFCLPEGRSRFSQPYIFHLFQEKAHFPCFLCFMSSALHISSLHLSFLILAWKWLRWCGLSPCGISSLGQTSPHTQMFLNAVCIQRPPWKKGSLSMTVSTALHPWVPHILMLSHTRSHYLSTNSLMPCCAKAGGLAWQQIWGGTCSNPVSPWPYNLVPPSSHMPWPGTMAVSLFSALSSKMPLHTFHLLLFHPENLVLNPMYWYITHHINHASVQHS